MRLRRVAGRFDPCPRITEPQNLISASLLPGAIAATTPALAGNSTRWSCWFCARSDFVATRWRTTLMHPTGGVVISMLYRQTAGTLAISHLRKTMVWRFDGRFYDRCERPYLNGRQKY